MNKFLVSAFADEYGASFAKQLEALKKFNLEYIELRNIDGQSLYSLSDERIQEIASTLKSNNIKVSSIGSPLGKIDITDDFNKHLEIAERIFKLAGIFETKNVRMFSFYNKTNIPFEDFEKEVFIRLEKMLDLADKYNVTLCHENEALIYGESPESCLKLLKHFKGRLKAVFDMGNFVLDQYNPLYGYELLKDYIEYFHLKDSLYKGAIVPLGKGESQAADILSCYINEYHKDVITTIEPHLQTFDGLNALVGKSFVNPYKYQTQEDAFEAGVVNSLNELKRALNMKNFVKDKLLVCIHDNRTLMGEHAAKDIADCFAKLLKEKEEINVIWAAAPSQNDVLKALVEDKSIEWNRINAYHMDEYIGLDKTAPQGFGNFLKDHIFGLVPFKSINYIDVEAKDPEKEAERYSALVSAVKIDVVVMGIGENGHIAFNDPGVADFNDKRVAKPVKLDELCRNQQVHDGCFKSLDEVPTHALTLTVPTLFNGSYLFCIVPCLTKANAVKETVNGTIDEHCPASILRRHDNAVLYLDEQSSSLLK